MKIINENITSLSVSEIKDEINKISVVDCYKNGCLIEIIKWLETYKRKTINIKETYTPNVGEYTSILLNKFINKE